jgi:hypothetical protein
MPQAIQIAWIIKVFGTRTGVVFFFENPASDAEIKVKNYDVARRCKILHIDSFSGFYEI